MKIENNIGLNTAPCGTPASFRNIDVVKLFILTANCQFVKKLFIQQII
jgi:hypothetical protein